MVVGGVVMREYDKQLYQHWKGASKPTRKLTEKAGGQGCGATSGTSNQKQTGNRDDSP